MMLGFENVDVPFVESIEKALHVKDATYRTIRGVPFEKGDVPFQETFKTLNEIGYGGPLRMEMWRDLEKDSDPVLSITHARKFVRGLIDGNMKTYPQGLKGD